MPEQHFAGGHGVVVNAARQQFLEAVEHLRAAWLSALPDDLVRAKCALAATEHFVALFEHNLLHLLCDPFWANEVLPPSLPLCLLNTPRRFGHLPVVAQVAVVVSQHGVSSSLFTDHSVSVLDEPVAAGRFGSCCYRGLDLGGFQRPIVIRAVRGADSDAMGKLVTVMSEWSLSRVVQPVLPCKLVVGQNLLLLPLDARAFELTLAEALADTSIDERTWLSLLADVATGLHELHSRNIVHGRLTIESSVVVARASDDCACAFVAKVGKMK